MYEDGEIVGTVSLDQPEVRPFDQCPTCHRYTVGPCSVCPPPPARERVELTSDEESRAAFERERELLKRRRYER